MKTNTFSLKKSFFLISLALLSPGIFAGSDRPLVPEYDSVSPDLNAQLLRLGKTCHSLDEPMVIDIRFKKHMDTSNLRLGVTIKGNTAGKGYTEISSSLPSSPASGLLVPWNYSITSQGKFDTTSFSTTPEEYTGRFCFTEQSQKGKPIPTMPDGPVHGYYPLFENSLPSAYVNQTTAEAKELNNRMFRQYCSGRPETKDSDHVWSDANIGVHNIPSNINGRITMEGTGFLTSGLFYMNVSPAATSQQQGTFEPSLNIQGAGQVVGTGAIAGQVSPYYLPTIAPHASATWTADGGVLYRFVLSNRNISLLQLDLIRQIPGYSEEKSTFTWQRNDGDLSRTLRYSHSPQQFLLERARAGQYDTAPDPYNNFYVSEDAASFFGGTLVAASSLNEEYKNYINNIMPLSLPPTSNGDINLVNTESLSFLIGAKNEYAGNGYVFKAYGQPLAFGPLYTGKTKAAGAMEVRNACY
ncbi:TPA: hypothetical protein R4D26_000899 [Salmonella enterica subsp. enterica serovar Stanley]|nr:hypothetical protein [Salmonella enterica subsp. enterica serovar Stanley]